jgi:hypothetical protein
MLLRLEERMLALGARDDDLAERNGYCDIRP